MELEGKVSTKLPPGFRFHPTDEELIIHYLTSQVALRPCPVSIIPEVNIYKFDPWDLPDKSELTENEWYFFTPRARKYPNGARPNRSTVSGYWKATGTDKAIHSGPKYVGVKKSLVFYTGRPPKGTKTDWIMHEYCLTDKRRHGNKKIGSMILDNWVLCRIYKKKKIDRILELNVEESNVQTDSALGNCAAEQQMKFPRTFSISQFLEMEHMVPLSEIISHTSYDPNFGFQTSMIGTGINGCGGGGDMTCQYTSSESSLMYNF